MNGCWLVARYSRFVLLAVLLISLTACMHWIRAYQTYLQLAEFDRHFAIEDKEIFAVIFNDPILYSSDLVALSKLQPSSSTPLGNGTRWRYIFRKVDAQNKLIKPGLSFFFDLDFNVEDRIAQWTFSPLFLHIAPPKFLEASLRSLSGGEINTEKGQLKANASAIIKIAAKLPDKATVVEQLGAPLDIEQEGGQEAYIYHFLLDTHDIEPGFENRALSVVRLTFDKTTHVLVRMGGRFAGVKVSIDYRKFLAE
ncbi:MAG: hypothetical protein ACKN9T_13770 [Candidatus Methylumidiphilus sp.]